MMTELDKKICDIFQDVVVRKDIVRELKGNAVVPTYVLEYLLGLHCTTSDEDTIRSGIAKVQDILKTHYVHRNESELVRSHIKEKGQHKIIDKIGVVLNDKNDIYEASFSNLGLSKVPVDSHTIKNHPKLLVSGVWCIADLEYDFSEDRNTTPWRISALKPIQISRFDMEEFLAGRKQFTTDEWIDFLIQSIGFNPEMFGKRNKLFHLVRLIPFCEHNYNLIELGPKGTGKSHIYSEFSPHGILISGGEVTIPKLFVNNATGKIGLVGFWDVVAFDEFAGKQKRVDSALVEILKNYMANKTFSRGIDMLGAEASMVFVGNTRHTLAAMLKHDDLFNDLPERYHDPAFLDRLHYYIPGWESDNLRTEMFCTSYGFVVDYLAEILRELRKTDGSDQYQNYFSLSSDISTRDRDGIHKTFSGLMKIVFPDGKAAKDEIEELLRFSIEGRKRIKDQLLRIDSTFTRTVFEYSDSSGNTHKVLTLEESQYPHHYYLNISETSTETAPESFPVDHQSERTNTPLFAATVSLETILEPKHFIINENQKGISFDDLFGPYLRGARKIEIIDPYIRNFPQQRNLMEFLETVVRFNTLEEEIAVHLVTEKDAYNERQQRDNFEKIKFSCYSLGIVFTWEFASDSSKAIHDRSIIIDTGWKIVLGRGLDVFQPYEKNDAFTFANRVQSQRACRAFETTILRYP